MSKDLPKFSRENILSSLVFFMSGVLLWMPTYVFAAPTAIDTTNYYNFAAMGGDSNYLYGTNSVGYYVVKADVNGVASIGKSLRSISPASKTYNGGNYSQNVVSRVWTTSVDGEIYISVANSTTGKYYLYRSIDGGLNYGDDANASNDNYVLMLGDIDGTEANQIAGVYIHGNGGFCEATIDGVRTLLIGEYHNVTSPSVAPTRLMKSTDGINWTTVVQWNPPGVTPAKIQHIHVVSQDPYSPYSIYIGTGDSDAHAGIIVWDGTGTLPNDSPVNYPSYSDPHYTGIGGSQQYRTLGFLFTADHVFWGVDSAGNSLGGIWRADRPVTNVTLADDSVLSLGSTGKREEMGYGIKTSDGTLLYLDYRDLTLTFPHNVWASGDDGLTWQRVADIMPNVAVSAYNFTRFFEWKSKIYISSISSAMAGKHSLITIEADLNGDFNGTRTILSPVYWVSPSGSDTAPNTSANTNVWGWSSTAPWKTLSYALSGNRVTKGGRIILASGTYSLETGTTSAWSSNTRPGPTDGELLIEGSGTSTTLVYLPSSAATSTLLELRMLENPLKIKNLSLWSEKSDSSVIYVENGASLTLESSRVGSSTVDLGTGSVIKNYGTTTIDKSVLLASGNDEIIYSGSASKASSTRSVYIGGSDSVKIDNATNFLSYNDVFYNYSGFGINVGVGSSASPTVKNGIFDSSAAYSIKDFAGLTETNIDYNCYSSSADSSVSDGGHSLASATISFVSTLLSNFKLSHDSDCINAGTDVGLTTDSIGNSLVGNPDAGAFEFQISSSPSNLTQYKSDGVTEIADGGSTDESSVVLAFGVSSVNGSDSLTPEVELRPSSESFTGTVTHTGTAVSYSGTIATGTVSITGLSSGSSYHWRARVTNSAGSSSWVSKGGSPDFSYQIGVVAPTLLTNTQSSVTQTAAVLSGTITATGGENSSNRGFVYGTGSHYGATTTESGSYGSGQFSMSVTGLACGTNYNFASFAQNSSGISYGDNKIFSTDQCQSLSSGGSTPQFRGSFVSNLYRINNLPCPTSICPSTPALVSIPISLYSMQTSFSRDMSIGDKGSDIQYLQKILNNYGYFVATSGPGSPGRETEIFGSLTRRAVMKLQKDYGLPVTGYFGPLTRLVVWYLK